MSDTATTATVAEESNAGTALTVSTDDELIRQLTERAKAEVLSLTGEDGLLRQLTKLVLEAGLEAEMSEHLGVDSMVISLVAKGMTTGEVQAHLAEVYGADVSRETISNITDSVLEEMAKWQNRPLDQGFGVVG